MKNCTQVLVMLTFLSVTMSSCGVMFGGSRYNGSIVVKNNPGAQIFVNGNKIGEGAAVGLFPRNRPLTVELKQEGCETKTQTFDNTFRGGNFFLSLVTWGLLGVVVDVATGASYKPDHKTNPAVQKIDMKNFQFTMDYTGCPSK